MTGSGDTPNDGRYCVWCGESLDWRSIDGLWCSEECLAEDVQAWLEAEADV